MNKISKTAASVEDNDDVHADSEAFESEFFSDNFDEDSDISFDEIPKMIGAVNKRRIKARRAIERIREQIALHNDLKDYNDFLN